MNRERGFTLIEVLVATAILVIAVGATLSALTDAIHTSQGVAMLADAQENLRASMNYMVHDIVEAGEGIPQGGIAVPNTGVTGPSNAPPPNGVSAINRPGLPAGTFPSFYTALPAITPGSLAGYPTATPNPAISGAVLLGPNTDMITVIYADNTLVDTNNHTLSEFPINLAATKGVGGCAGTLSNAGDVVTFDKNCIIISAGNTAIQAGDLIMFQSPASSEPIIEYVSSAAGQTLNFLAGDPYGFNGTGAAAGTIAGLQAPVGSGKYPPTTATRIWMITYYLDTQTNPMRPQLMRQVNFRLPEPVGDVLEDLSISYDLAETGVPPVNPNQPQPIWPDSTSQIRKVNLFLAARSEAAYTPTNTYFRNNLATEVNIRNLSFFNQFQ